MMGQGTHSTNGAQLSGGSGGGALAGQTVRASPCLLGFNVSLVFGPPVGTEHSTAAPR